MHGNDISSGAHFGKISCVVARLFALHSIGHGPRLPVLLDQNDIKYDVVLAWVLVSEVMAV